MIDMSTYTFEKPPSIVDPVLYVLCAEATSDAMIHTIPYVHTYCTYQTTCSVRPGTIVVWEEHNSTPYTLCIPYIGSN